MASTDKLEYKGFVAWIEVDNKPTTPYSSTIDRKKKSVSCFIASEESKRFSVNFSASDPKCSLHLRLQLDGHQVSNRFYDRNGTKEAKIRIADCWTSDSTYRPFVFMPLNTTDDEAYADKAQLSQRSGSGSKNHTSSQHDKLGEITLNVYRIVNLQTICEKREPLRPEDTIERIPTSAPVHEKTMKAAMTHHQVSYGNVVKTKRKSTKPVVYGTTKELIVSFAFKYKPLQVLRNLGKAPLSPPLPSLSLKRPSPSSSPFPKTETESASSSTSEVPPTTLTTSIGRVSPSIPPRLKVEPAVVSIPSIPVTPAPAPSPAFTPKFKPTPTPTPTPTPSPWEIWGLGPSSIQSLPPTELEKCTMPTPMHTSMDMAIPVLTLPDTPTATLPMSMPDFVPMSTDSTSFSSECQWSGFDVCPDSEELERKVDLLVCSEDVEMKQEILEDGVGVGEDGDEDDDDDDDGEEILKVLLELQARVQKRQETKKRKRQEAAAAAAAASVSVRKSSSSLTVPVAMSPSQSSDSTLVSSPSPSRPRKRVKLEAGPMVSFSPGDSKEIIDLTMC